MIICTGKSHGCTAVPSHICFARDKFQPCQQDLLKLPEFEVLGYYYHICIDVPEQTASSTLQQNDHGRVLIA